MSKTLILVTLLAFTCLGFVYFFVGVPEIYVENMPENSALHIYDDPNQQINQIDIFAVYFVPSNKADQINNNWKEVMESSLLRLSQFHALQFFGLSTINYNIYPKPIVGEMDGLEYDTQSTQGGNPYGLINISKELNKRVFNIKGDLYRPEFFSARGARSYPVLGIVYEGVGASGGIIYDSEEKNVADISKEIGLPENLIHLVDIEAVDGFFLANIFFLEESSVLGKENSIFAHEFYHTLGLPDEYESPGQYDAPTSQDIMGSGRFSPIEKTYLDRKNLNHLGI